MAHSSDSAKSKPGGFLKRHKKLVISLAIVIVVAVVAIVLLTGMRAGAGSALQTPQTLTLERMDLEQIVSGTGTLQSTSSREVNSTLSYDIVEVCVQEGDKVTKGQTLARLDTTELDKDIADAQKSIADAQAADALSLSQAQRKLQEAYDQRTLDDERLSGEIDKAADSLNTAISERNGAKSDRDAKKSELKTAQKALDKAKQTDPNYQQLAEVQAKAQTAYDAAEQALQAKESAVTQAQNAYETAVQTKDTTLRNDTISIENAQDNVDSQSIKDSASAERNKLDGYLEDKEKSNIKAPMDGTVTAMTAKVGNSAGGSGGAVAATGSTAGTTGTSSSALFTIEKTDKLEMTASIPEYDAVNVRVGMRALLTSDALSESEWGGKVKSISPKATDEDGNFTVVVEVTSNVEQLAIGMSVKVNIITESEADVFAVPYDAVTTNEAGESVVYVWTPQEGASTGGPGFAPPAASSEADSSGEKADLPASRGGKEMVVQTGIETDYYIEISSDGLEEGLVLLADPEGKNVSSESSGAFGMFPGGGGF